MFRVLGGEDHIFMVLVTAAALKPGILKEAETAVAEK